jgi:hypothetical protein
LPGDGFPQAYTIGMRTGSSQLGSHIAGGKRRSCSFGTVWTCWFSPTRLQLCSSPVSHWPIYSR